MEATFVLAANTRRYGGDPILSPFADPDGRPPRPRPLRVPLAQDAHAVVRPPLARKGRAPSGSRACSRLAVRSFSARSLAGYELDVQVDGDAVTTTPFAIGPAAGRVLIVVPE